MWKPSPLLVHQARVFYEGVRMADLTSAGILVQQCAADLFAERQRCKMIVPFPRDELVAVQLEIFREYAKRAKELGLGVAPSDLMMFGYSVHAALAELERAH